MKKNALWVVLFFCFLSAFPLPALSQKKTSRHPAPTSSVRPAALPAVETLDQKIGRIARAYGLDPRLFRALIYTESVYKIRAVSYKGAACYTQLMPDTARRFGLRVDGAVDERYEPEKCLTVGAYYLSWLLKTFRGDVRLALAGYNAGEGSVIKYGWRVPPYRETVLYVEKICYLYYGQAGHGIALAYNQPLAQSWVNAHYAAGGGRYRLAPPAYSPAATVAENTPVPAAVAEKKLPVLKANDSEKVPVKRIFVEDSSPRIRTQSLSFGNK